MNAHDHTDIATPTPAPSHSEESVDKPQDFAGLTKTIRSRTTDLLAVAIIIAGGLGVGSQVARWWTTDESELGPPAAADVNLTWGGDAPVTLEFGDRPIQLQRQQVTGDRETAIEQLVANCAGVAQKTRDIVTDIVPAERNLLAMLQRQQPVLEGKGAWSVYRIEQPLTLVIATCDITAASGTEIPNAKNETNSQAEQASQRVVCWGMAQPSQPGVWVLFTLQPTGGKQASGPEWGEVQLPAGCRKIMSLRDASGGALVAFEGEGVAGDWKIWFDEWFAEHRWQPAQSWAESPVGWSIAYRPADENNTGRVDVSFSSVSERRLNGLISITTPARETSEGSQP